MLKGKKIQSQETKQASEPNSHVAEVLELSNWEFKITMINMLRTLMEKVHNMQEQMSNESREMTTKNQNKMLEIKN